MINKYQKQQIIEYLPIAIAIASECKGDESYYFERISEEVYNQYVREYLFESVPERKEISECLLELFYADEKTKEVVNNMKKFNNQLVKMFEEKI